MKTLLVATCSFILAHPQFIWAQVQQAWVGFTNGTPSALKVGSAAEVYVAGSAVGTNGTTDYLTAKYDANGLQLWSAFYNGPSNAVDFASALAIDQAGNVYVTGIADRSTNNEGGVIATAKYDSSGNQLWAARSKPPDPELWSVDRPVAIAVDGSGNVIVSSSVTVQDFRSGPSDNYLTIEYGPSGKELWAVRYGPSGNDKASAMVVDSAGNVYVTGSSRNDCPGELCISDYATVKYDSEGRQLWASLYNGHGHSDDSAWAIAVDSAGNVYVTGSSAPDCRGDVMGGIVCPAIGYVTVKYDADGNQLWVAGYSGPADDDYAKAIAFDSLGNVVVTGWSGIDVNGDLGRDFVTIKYDPQGREMWVARDGTPNHANYASALVGDTLGNVYVTGSSWTTNTYSDYATLKYDANGNQLWEVRYGGGKARTVVVDNANNVYVAGDAGVVKYIQTDLPGRPNITSPPQSQSVTEGETVTVSVVAAGAEPLSYQWRWNGMNIPGETNLTLLLLYVQAVQAGEYSVAVSNSVGVIVSAGARLTVSPLLQLAWMAADGNGSDAAANALAVDDGGNVYVAGYVTDSGGQSDYATVMYDARGNQVWHARYDGPGHSSDVAVAIAVDKPRNVYVTGYSRGAGAGDDYATIKYDPLGNVLWVARYNGPGDTMDRPACNPSALAVDAIGNVYVTGSCGTVKYDRNANQLWVATNVPGVALRVDGSGNVYVTGSLHAAIGADFATVKYDANGNQLWMAIYNGPANLADYPVALAVDRFGSVYVTGTSWTTNTYSDYVTLKYDANGNAFWVARYEGPTHAYDDPSAIAVDDVGGVYVTGESDEDIVTVKYGADGQQVWVARYDGPAGGVDAPSAMAVDAAGNVYVAGLGPETVANPNGFFDIIGFGTLKYDSAGHQLAVARVPYGGARALALDADGDVYVAGFSWGGGLVTLKYVQSTITTRFSPTTISTSGQLQFKLIGQAQRSYEIQASTDLTRWTTVTNLFSETGVMAFEAEIDGPQRFYRAVKRPAPIPKLLSPQPGALLDNGRSNGSDYIIWDFDWSDVLGASQYQLFVKNVNAVNPVIDVTTTTSFYHYAQYGSSIIEQNRRDWAWTVRAMIGGVWGHWSELRSFDVEPENTDPPTPP